MASISPGNFADLDVTTSPRASPRRSRAQPLNSPTSPARVHITSPAPIQSPKQRAKERHRQAFEKALNHSILDIEKIRNLAWMGIPNEYRPTVWRLFLDYEPISRDSVKSTLEHKRNDYFDCLDRLYGPTQQALWTSSQRATIRQIDIDLPRTPNKLLKDERVKQLFEHILFVWAVRHPASGYVQGMNDILLPFFIVFISPHLDPLSTEEICQLENIDDISNQALREVEGDCFWCFSKLLDGIQDVYTKEQPGLFRMMDQLRDIINRVDPELADWIESNGIDYQQFAFRWINCLLVREFPLPLLFRIWDLNLSQVSRIATVHVFACAAMLSQLKPRLSNLCGSDFIVAMQDIGPSTWTEDDVETILAQAYVYERTAALSPARSQ